MSATNLLPCPFCGDEPEYARDGEYHIVRCPECGAEMADEKKRFARDAWNRRPAPNPAPEE